MGKLADKIAVVTGGNGGIGFGIVQAFIDEGAKVAAFDISSPASPDSDTLMSIHCNIASPEDVEKAVKAVIEKWGRIDIVVNNAGTMDAMDGAGEVDDKTWARCISVNLNGPFHMIRATVPHLLKNDGPAKGAIINICSISSIRGSAAGAAYTASKHGLLGLSRNTAWMYRNKGIRCNAVLPGGVHTNLITNSAVTLNPESLQSTLGPYLACNPGLVPIPDIARAVVFLASSDSVNGAEVSVDNGWLTS